MAILRAATINGAKALGYDADLGSLTVGKLADLLILSADPLEDIGNTARIESVMRGGTLYDGETLDQIWPISRKHPEGWWKALEPRIR
jgi:imidazolonepropionase-like amidohydrolase